MTPSARITEVGPRDGLQNEPQTVPAATKIDLIRRLAAAGLRHIEATAFVSPKWVPQMADHAEVIAGLGELPGVRLSALVPNLQGFEAAEAAGVKTVAVFVSASEGFSQRNVNCSIADAFKRYEPVFLAARRKGIAVRGYVSCVIACPYDGPVAPAQVARIAAELDGLGCYEISLGDTIGVGTPNSVQTMLEAVVKTVPAERLAGHFHDTYGMAIANAFAAWQFGLRSFDSSVAGLGGCPYANGATGNVATEDLVYLLHGLGASTGVNLEALTGCSAWISAALNREPSAHVTRAMLAKQGTRTART